MSSVSVVSQMISRVLPRRQVGWIGIDLGCRQIKLAQVEKRGDRWCLAQHDVLTPPEGDYATCAVTAISEHHPHASAFVGRDVACAASMAVSELLTMELPDGSDDELRLMIEQNLEGADDDSAEPRQFAFWRGQFVRHLDDGMTQVHVATAQRSMVKTVAEGLYRHGLHCQVFDVLPFALIRAAAMLPDADASQPVAMFDWSGSSPLFMIIKEHTPAYLRQFRNCGVEQIVELLSTKLEINRLECRHLLSEYSLDQHPNGRSSVREIIAELLAEPLKSLTREFERTLSYVKQQKRELWPNKMWICGGGASLAGVEATLTHVTGIKSCLWQLDDLVHHGLPVPPAHQALLTTAMALSSLAFDK